MKRKLHAIISSPWVFCKNKGLSVSGACAGRNKFLFFEHAKFVKFNRFLRGPLWSIFWVRNFNFGTRINHDGFFEFYNTTIEWLIRMVLVHGILMNTLPSLIWKVKNWPSLVCLFFVWIILIDQLAKHAKATTIAAAAAIGQQLRLMLLLIRFNYNQ